MKWGRVGAVVAFLALTLFWIWALFFASKESINRIGDREWAERAETICAEADRAREDMADYRELEGDDIAMLAERADLVDQATTIVEDALDQIVIVIPTDEKGQGIVPDWESDYRQYIADRRAYAERLRNGEDVPFSETAIEGIPISERIERFANDNDMSSCAPPTDL